MPVERQHAGHSSACRMADDDVRLELHLRQQFGHTACHARYRKQSGNVGILRHGGETMTRKINGDHGEVLAQQRHQMAP